MPALDFEILVISKYIDNQAGRFLNYLLIMYVGLRVNEGRGRV